MTKKHPILVVVVVVVLVTVVVAFAGCVVCLAKTSSPVTDAVEDSSFVNSVMVIGTPVVTQSGQLYE